MEAVSSSGSASLAQDAHVVSTYTNTRQTGELELNTSLVPPTDPGPCNADVVWTYTNTRQTGKLELKKSLVPSTDSGLFNLYIKQGTCTKASASTVGDAVSLRDALPIFPTGSYDLSETAGTSTSLSDYDS